MQFEGGLFPYANSVNPIFFNKKSIASGTEIKKI
jgi:hypothetical protein